MLVLKVSLKTNAVLGTFLLKVRDNSVRLVFSSIGRNTKLSPKEILFQDTHVYV